MSIILVEVVVFIRNQTLELKVLETYSWRTARFAQLFLKNDGSGFLSLVEKSK